MGYYDSYNPDLLRFIPPDAKTVLEIGCGEGALCEAYRRVNPGVVWLGIEKELSAARIATAKGAKMVGVDIDADDPALAIYSCDRAMADQKVDVLIFGDVLEHLRDPWGAIKRMMAFIAPGAQVLASIPNVQHWTVIRDLLEGKWDYTDSGLLDRTHLRFFTLKSIREMFDAAGLQVFEIVGRDICNEGFYEWADDAFGSEQTGLSKEMRAYQYVVRAIKPADHATSGIVVNGKWEPYATIPRLHIHAVTAEACCARPRILEPFAMLSTIPGVKCTTGEWPGKPDVLILQRRELNMIRNPVYRTSESVIIAEVDDLPEALGMDSGDLRACHAIQCSTEALAEVCRKYNPHVMVFPNQIAELPPFHERNKDPMEVNLFFGAQNRQGDWAPIMPTLNRILNNLSGVTMNVVHDREFFDAIESDRKQFFEFAPYAEYRGILSMCDIALLPLEDTPFNRCKSDIKFLECAAEGVTVVAGITAYFKTLTSSPPDSMGMFYDSKFCKGGKFCVQTGGQDEFEMVLRHLIEEPEWRHKYAETAYAYVRDNRLLSQHYRARYEWYQSLISSKQALTDSLLERCPELDLQLSHSQR